MSKQCDRMDAKVIRKDGSSFWQEVYQNCSEVSEDERLVTEEEMKDLFYEIVTRDERASWDYERIELEYTWGKEILKTTIY